MKKVIMIEGMHCMNCASRANKALSGVQGVEEVDMQLKKNRAVVTVDANVTDQALKDAVNEAGYQAVSIEEKKGLLG